MTLSPPDPPLADEAIRLLPLTPAYTAELEALVLEEDVRQFTRVPSEPPAGFVATVTDRAVARLNVFTYAGAVLGGVLTGIFATAHHLRVGFVVLAVLAAVSAMLAGAFRPARVALVGVSEATPPAD